MGVRHLPARCDAACKRQEKSSEGRPNGQPHYPAVPTPDLFIRPYSILENPPPRSRKVGSSAPGTATLHPQSAGGGPPGLEHHARPGPGAGYTCRCNSPECSLRLQEGVHPVNTLSGYLQGRLNLVDGCRGFKPILIDIPFASHTSDNAEFFITTHLGPIRPAGATLITPPREHTGVDCHAAHSPKNPPGALFYRAPPVGRPC